MRRFECRLVIVGGGPAGMSAAVAAYEAGERDILILEREHTLGGILTQCIHNGFGLHRFGEELTGPEYAYRYEKSVKELGIKYYTDCTVTGISSDRTVSAVSAEEGMFKIQAGAVIVATGCRERPRGALNIPGTRPSGVYTAGTAQKFVNIKGYMPGKEIVILGSGDIGLIMARRMTLEGATVRAVLEIMPYSSGLARNIEQCLNDYGIPLYLSHTVSEIHGKERIEGVSVVRVDENRRPVPGGEMYIPCDTLLLSCGLIPENELASGGLAMCDVTTGGCIVDQDRESSAEGIFFCGNVLHVHDLVDYVSEEAAIAGRAAAAFVRGDKRGDVNISVHFDKNIRYCVPQKITSLKDTDIYFRVKDVHRGATVCVNVGGRVVSEQKKIRLAPGEMETVHITERMLAENTGDITVSVIPSGV